LDDGQLNAEDSRKLKDFLKLSGVNWKEEYIPFLQLEKNDKKTISISRKIPYEPNDTNIKVSPIIDEKGSYEFILENTPPFFIKLNNDNTKAILEIDHNPICEFVVKNENNKLNIYSPKKISLSAIITIYRNLRENYEYSLRYEEADKFFIKEMELKRKYRERIVKDRYTIKKNSWFRRNISLTGLYHVLLNYGQDYKRPALIALSIVLVPILYSFIQILLSNRNLAFAKFSNAIVTNLRDIFGIDPSQGVSGYFIGIATVSILGGLFIPALKRRFEKRFRR
jgi:hypothetical protein